MVKYLAGMIVFPFFKKIKEVAFIAVHPILKNAFCVYSHLTYVEKTMLFNLSKNSKSILEIGSYIGASACCFGAALKEAGSGKLICIDTWNNDAMSEGNRDTWKEFQNNTREYKNYIVPVRGFSTNVIQTVREISPTLNVLFIDGDHTYAGVKADWDAYKSFLNEGATVIFHDYGWAEGVKRVVHEDVMPLVSNHGQLPNMWWGKIGKAA
jgi:predicted O-methyltransferase YrrM